MVFHWFQAHREISVGFKLDLKTITIDTYKERIVNLNIYIEIQNNCIHSNTEYIYKLKFLHLYFLEESLQYIRIKYLDNQSNLSNLPFKQLKYWEFSYQKYILFDEIKLLKSIKQIANIIKLEVVKPSTWKINPRDSIYAEKKKTFQRVAQKSFKMKHRRIYLNQIFEYS